MNARPESVSLEPLLEQLGLRQARGGGISASAMRPLEPNQRDKMPLRVPRLLRYEIVGGPFVFPSQSVYLNCDGIPRFPYDHYVHTLLVQWPSRQRMQLPNHSPETARKGPGNRYCRVRLAAS